MGLSTLLTLIGVAIVILAIYLYVPELLAKRRMRKEQAKREFDSGGTE